MLKPLFRMLISGLFATMLGLIVVSVEGCAAQIKQGSLPEDGSVPKVTRRTSIQLTGEGAGSISVLAFSSDSKHLAVLYDSTYKHASDLIVWDLLNHREETRIVSLPLFGFPFLKLLWSADNKTITLGRGLGRQSVLFWDSTTGKSAQHLEQGVIASSAAYNREGTRLLVNSPSFRGMDGSFRVYDTTTWSSVNYDAGGLYVQCLAWTSDGKVFLAGLWPKTSVGRTIDGIAPQMADALARVVDPKGTTPSRSIVLSHGTPDTRFPGVIVPGPFFPESIAKAASADVVALGFGRIVTIDANNLRVLSEYASIGGPNEVSNLPDGFLGANVALSPDGKFLYLMGRHGEQGLIIEAIGGRQVGSFPGADRGLAVSPDGKTLAEGNFDRIEILNTNLN